MDEHQQQQVRRRQDIHDIQRMDGQRQSDHRQEIMRMEQVMERIVQRIWYYIHVLRKQQQRQQ